eukprot:9141612-Karenia_brevis.AAC.1
MSKGGQWYTSHEFANTRLTVWAFAIVGHASQAFFDAMATISVCKKEGLWLRVAPLLNELDETRRECLKSDVISFNAAISTCGKSGQWQRLAPLLVDVTASTID